jgi:hypothetical protein
LFLHSSAAAQQPHTLTGNIRTHEKFHSTILSNDRDLIVYLPPGGEDGIDPRVPFSAKDVR